MKQKTIALLITGIVLSANLAAAQTNIPDPLQGRGFATIVNSIISFANSVLPPLLVLMVLIAGFFYMTAGGNSQRITTAHKILIWALVGAAIVLLANSTPTIICQLIGGCANLP